MALTDTQARRIYMEWTYQHSVISLKKFRESHGLTSPQVRAALVQGRDAHIKRSENLAKAAAKAAEVIRRRRRNSEARELRNISRLFNLIHINLFSLDATLSYGRVTDAITKLANVMDIYSGDPQKVWLVLVGEGFPVETLSDLLEGAYWHFTERNNGPGSVEFSALAALGKVVAPCAVSNSSKRENPAYDSLAMMAEFAGDIKDYNTNDK